MIHANEAKAEVLNAKQNFDEVQENYWKELEDGLSELIMNAAKDGRSEVSSTVDKRFNEYVKQKINDAGYSCTIHPSLRTDTSYKITIG